MKTKQILPALTGFALASPLAAGILLQNDFEAETVGGFPASGFIAINAGGVKVVEDDTTGTPFGASNQYFRLGQANLRVRTNIPGGDLNGLTQVSFDLVEPSGVGTSTLRLGFASSGLDLNAGGTAYGLSINNGTLATEDNTSIESGTLPTLVEDQAYSFEYTLNRTGAVASYPDPTNPANPDLSLDDGRLALWVQNLGDSTWSGPIILTTTQVNPPLEFLFRCFSTNDNEVYVDNFAVTDAGTWDGEGADGLWSTATNWVGDVTPSAGDPLVFGTSPDSFLTNDLAPGTSFSGLSFVPTAINYSMTGVGITLTGPVINESPATQIIGLPIELADNLEVQVNGGGIILDGVISGGFGLEKTGSETVQLTNLNTYSGDTTVSEGTLQLGDGFLTGGVSGAIINNSTLILQPAADYELSNSLSGSGELRLIGTPVFRLTGTNTYTGETLIDGGILRLDGSSNLPTGGTLAFIGTDGQLDADNKAVNLGELRANDSAPGSHTIVGTGSVTVSGGNLLVGPGSGSSPGDTVSLDLSGLTSFTYDNASGNVQVGNLLNDGNNRTGILSLSDLSVLTADRIRVQQVISGTSIPSFGLLELGADTTFNTDEIEIGHSGRDSGLVAFRSGLATGTLTLRATDGTGRAAIDIGRRSSSFHPNHDVGIDLVSGGSITSTLDALASSVTIGDLGFGNSVTQNAFIRMGGGTLDATSINLGKLGNGGGSNATLNSTFSLDGGSVITPTLTFGDNTSPTSALNATFALNSGSLSTTIIQAGTESGTGSSQRTLELNGGTLSNLSSTSLTITDVNLNVPAGAAPTLNIESGQTATMGANSISEFGIDSSSSSAGTLTVIGDLVLGSGAELRITDEAAILTPLAVGTKFTLVDYTAGSLAGTFEDLSASPINDGDLITVGPNVFEIDYDDTLGGGFMAVTITVDASFDFANFVYDMSDRLVSNGVALSTDGWLGDDLPNWINASFSGGLYARNNNDGDDRITRVNDTGFSYDIPADALLVTFDVITRSNNNTWRASLTTGGGDTLGLGYEGSTDKIFLLDGTTRIDQAGTTVFPGDVYSTLRIIVDLVAGTADVINDPDGAATVVINDATVNVTGALLAATDGLGMRTNSKFTGVARYTISVTSPAGTASEYDTWADGFGLDPETDGAPGEDPDEDGQSNLEEFATNDDPTSGSASGKVAGLVQDVGGEDVLTFTLPVRGSATPFSGSTQQVSDAVDGIVYRIQGSDDLADWSTMVISEVNPALSAGLPALDAGWEYRTFRTPGAIDADPADFIRAVIEAAP